MTSLILRTATRMLMSILLLFSLFLLLRGHNEPGGGFVGGLVAAAAFILYAIAVDVDSARRLLRIEPHTLIAAGLLVAAASGTLGLAAGKPFLTGIWFTWTLPDQEKLSVGTVLGFDIGVYLVVVGATLAVILTLLEER
jgi:multicomponent Na+:H+ antiporter subunit B